VIPLLLCEGRLQLGSQVDEKRKSSGLGFPASPTRACHRTLETIFANDSSACHQVANCIFGSWSDPCISLSISSSRAYSSRVEFGSEAHTSSLLKGARVQFIALWLGLSVSCWPFSHGSTAPHASSLLSLSSLSSSLSLSFPFLLFLLFFIIAS